MQSDLTKLAKEVSGKYKKIAVTGAAGFIGSHIVEELIGTGVDLVGIDDLSAGKKSNVDMFEKYDNYKFIKCDVTNYEELKEALKDVDMVFHNAASKKNVCLIDPRRDLQVNGEGAFNIVELARDLGIKKIVHASTGSVYGEPSIFPQTEDHPLLPVSYYGVSKLAGERYCIAFNKLYDIDVTVLRYFHVYGPRQEFHDDFGGVVSIFLRRIMDGLNPIVHGDGSQIRTFTNVKDVVKANLLVAVKEETKGQVYNCAAGIKVSIKELADFFVDQFKEKNLSIEYGDALIGDPQKFEVSNEKISNLGMSFEKDFYAGVEPCIRWIKELYLK